MSRFPVTYVNITHPVLDGFEVTSPKLEMSSDWQREVDQLLESLAKVASLSVNVTCGMHVHVSFPEPFTLGQLRNLAKSTIWLEEVLLGLISPSRRESKYIKGLRRHIPLAPGLDAVKTATERIDVDFRATRTRNTRKTIQALVDWLQPSPDAKYHFVNFLNVTTPDDKGTVELRFPPPSTRSEPALLWMYLAVGFVSVSVNLTDPTMLAPTIGGLSVLLHSVDREANPLRGIQAPVFE